MLHLLALHVLAGSLPSCGGFTSQANLDSCRYLQFLPFHRSFCYRRHRPKIYQFSSSGLSSLEMVLEENRGGAGNKDRGEKVQQLVNIKPFLELNASSAPSFPPNRRQQFSSSLDERTRRLIKTEQWNEGCFEEAQEIIKAWSHRQSRKAATTVERIIRRVVQEEQTKHVDIHQYINMSTMYTYAIQGWANSWEKGAAAERAEEILDTMQRRFVDGDHRIQPKIQAFNLVLLAYARSGLSDAPQQALRVLEKLQEWHSSGDTDVTPNKESYATVLRAFSKTGKPEAPMHVKRLLEHLEQLSEQEGYEEARPNYMCHGAYIGALVDAMDRDYITGEEAAEKADAYLYELLESPYEEARPDSWCFNQVLALWSRSGSLDMVDRAERIMKDFELYHQRSGYTEKTKPNTNSYNCLIACYSRSISWQKGTKAHSVLEKMKASNYTSASPDAVTYNTGMFLEFF